MFWGQLHIKYLFVQEQYRLQGIATELMKHAVEFAQSRGCTFAFVETMNFQALEFYRKLGFNIELSRYGYNKGSSFHYLKRDLIGAARPLTIRPLTQSDISIIVSQFSQHNWPKPGSTFETYLKEQHAQDRLVWVAYDKDQFVGYATLK